MPASGSVFEDLTFTGPSRRRKPSRPSISADELARLLALAEEVARFGSWELNVNEPRAKWSPGMFKIFGITPRSLGFTWEEYTSFIHPDDREAALKNAQTMLSSSLNHRESYDYRIIRPDGAVRIINSQRQVKETDETGKATVVVGVDQDVTEQAKSEEALKRSVERFRIVAEAANVMVYEADVATEKIDFLNGSEQLVGYNAPANVTIDWVFTQMHPDDRASVQTAVNQVISDPTKDKYSIEYRLKHKNGNYIIVKDTTKAIKDKNGKAVTLIGGIRDITQRKQDQEKIREYNKHLEQLVIERSKQLVEYERLAAIGQIAGMVGHDIRNPLQALTGEVYLIRTELDNVDDAEARGSINESLDSVDENIGYINKIVADLQDYSRKLHPENTEVALSSLISEVFKAIKIPNKIQLSLNIDSAPKVKADPTFLRRALTNLINNAIQAMPDGGKLTVTAYQEDNHVCITVADTGVGIDEALKAKVFTPLFTTKAKGQGLGLAVVKRLVEAQGGSICFDSQVGAGTKFIIKLPTKHT